MNHIQRAIDLYVMLRFIQDKELKEQYLSYRKQNDRQLADEISKMLAADDAQ